MRRSLLVLLMAVAAVAPATARAHPFGFPPVVLIALQGDEVTLHWGVDPRSPDDAAVLAVHLGIVEPGDEGPPPTLTEAQDAGLSNSPLLAAYLREHLAVSGDGEECREGISIPGSFSARGAQASYDCGSKPREVLVEVTMLQDIDPAYRTVGFASEALSPRRAIFTSASDEHLFLAAGDEGPSTTWVPVLVAVVALVVAAGWLLRRSLAQKVSG